MKNCIQKANKIQKTLAVIFVLVQGALSSFGQTSTTAGAWETGGNWNTNTSPSTSSLGANVIINKAMTFSSGSITGWTNGTTITITNTGSLTVTGNFDLTGVGVDLQINSGGKLTVSGTTSVTNNAKITVKGANGIDLAGLTVKSAGTVTINSGASGKVTSLTTTSNSDAILSNSGTFTVNGAVSSSGVITNNSGATMTVTGTFTQQNSGNQFNNYGNVNISSNAFAYGLIQLYPGTSAHSEFVVGGNLTVDANPWLLVGTDVSACGSAITYYADAVIKGNIVISGSGDVTVKQNGRLVVFGNFDGTASTGGSLFTLNCGGQAYVNGKVDLTTGGGNTVTNSNSASSPTGSDGTARVGLYVNGTTTAQTKTGTIDNKAQLKTNDLPFYNYIGSLSGSPLPITLISFTGEATSDGVELNWSTSFEKNFDKFVIERASNNGSFLAIGEVNGAGNTIVLQNYSFVDHSAPIGTNYYRLKSVDLDNSFTYSKVVSIETIKAAPFSIYPNPSKSGDHVNVVLSVDPDADDVFKVLDLRGTEITTGILDTDSGALTFTQTLNPGTYLISFSYDGNHYVERLVIQ